MALQLKIYTVCFVAFIWLVKTILAALPGYSTRSKRLKFAWFFIFQMINFQFYRFFFLLSIQQTKPLTGKAGELVQSFTAKISEVSEKLKAENPEFVDKHVRALVDEVEKLNEKLKVEGAVVSDKAQGLLKVIADNAVSSATQLKEQVEAAIAKKN